MQIQLKVELDVGYNFKAKSNKSNNTDRPHTKDLIDFKLSY